MTDRVVLSVPARGEFAKAVRMTAASLVSRMGMSFDEVDDVKIAAEEAFVYACDRTGEDACVDVVFEMHGQELRMQVGPVPCAEDEDKDGEHLGRYARFILESVCDSFEMCDEGAEGCYIRTVKRHGAPEDARA